MGGDYAAAREIMSNPVGMSVVLAVVDKVILNTSGQYADCSILQNGDPIRAKDAPMFAGNGFGMYRKLTVGTVVVICCEFGDPDGQNTIVGVIHNNKNAVPSEAIGAPDDFWLVTPDGKNIQLKAPGAGKVIMHSDVEIKEDLDVVGSATAGSLHADNGMDMLYAGVPARISEITVVDGIVTNLVLV